MAYGWRGGRRFIGESKLQDCITPTWSDGQFGECLILEAPDLSLLKDLGTRLIIETLGMGSGNEATE